MPRPSYEHQDLRDRQGHLSSRVNILSKSFIANLWIKVIIRAIEDIALYRVMRIRGKRLTEDDLAYEISAEEFLFDDDHRIPMDDYLVDVDCVECDEIWTAPMSTVVGHDSQCPHCQCQVSKKRVEYTITDNQVVKDISLKELIELWGVDDVVQFRAGCKKKIEDMVRKKLEFYANKEK